MNLFALERGMINLNFEGSFIKFGKLDQKLWPKCKNITFQKRQKKTNKLDADWTYLMMKVRQREKT